MSRSDLLWVGGMVRYSRGGKKLVSSKWGIARHARSSAFDEYPGWYDPAAAGGESTILPVLRLQNPAAEIGILVSEKNKCARGEVRRLKWQDKMCGEMKVHSGWLPKFG
jgi:hypothetical protein